MVMDPRFDEPCFSVDDFNFESNTPFHDPNQSLNFANGFKPSDPTALGLDPFAAPLISTKPDASNKRPGISDLDGEFVFPAESDRGSLDSSLSAVGGDSPSTSDDSNSSEHVLKYISQILMEDDAEDKTWIFTDDFALQVQDTEKSLYDALGEQHPRSLPDELQKFDASQFIGSPISNLFGSSSEEGSHLVENAFNENDSIVQFKRGLEEGSKFIPSSPQLVVDFDNKDETAGSKGRKNHEREDLSLAEGRATKQTASYVDPEEAKLSELLDKVLLCTEEVERRKSAGDDLQTSAPLRRSNGGRGRGRRQGNNKVVDLRALLIQCAEAVSSNDLKAANELLKQIRENSSPSGDGFQRLAYYFANGLEARMARTHGWTQSYYASVASKRVDVADLLKAYQVHLSVSPFKRFSLTYMNYMIWKLSENATVLHIIDFGISSGFQWPLLIEKLGGQVGPPKLRITGIDLPRPGFRPAERVEETGRRLAWYCERFNVPFEYNALASSKWEAIKIEDLKIRSGEMIVVNSLFRLRNLLDDETGEGESPRDAVLNLIRRIKPDVFVHANSNGSYNSPFFVTRFREALLHMSSIYDRLDAIFSRESKDSEVRRALESEFYGQEILNVIACEGAERVERPETYKQWQSRHVRAGFKQLPLDEAVIRKLRERLQVWYHKDHVLDVDGNWMLLGWKGRILCAVTCLVPV